MIVKEFKAKAKKENGYTANGEYRKFYNQAKNELVKRHNDEHKAIMLELGYKPAPKKVKKIEKKEVVKKQ